MFVVCLLSDPKRTTHSLPAIQAPSVLWVSLPGPTGVPSDAQAGWHRGQKRQP